MTAVMARVVSGSVPSPSQRPHVQELGRRSRPRRRRHHGRRTAPAELIAREEAGPLRVRELARPAADAPAADPASRIAPPVLEEEPDGEPQHSHRQQRQQDGRDELRRRIALRLVRSPSIRRRRSAAGITGGRVGVGEHQRRIRRLLRRGRRASRRRRRRLQGREEGRRRSRRCLGRRRR